MGNAGWMKRPNVVVFLTDDHGQWASGCYGAKDLSTPTLDFLASTGTRFTRSTTPCPVCSPARASFWTGRIPSQHGIHDWIQEKTYSGPWMSGERNLAQVLKMAGYRTGFVGKWHCGQSWVPQPGFDYYLGENKDQYPHRGVCRFTENGKEVEWNGQRSAFVTRKAVDFIRNTQSAEPFFLFAGYVDTHSPFTEHPERLVARHARSRFASIPDETYVGKAARVPGRKPAVAEHRRRLRQYAAAVEYIDQQVGDVLDAIEAKGILDNTLVVYTSDHGHMNGHHGLYFKGNATSPQNFFEESIQVPCLMRLPGTVPNTVFDKPFNHCDLFQTICDVAGAMETGVAAVERNSPGASVLGALHGRGPWRDATFCEYGNARMVRSGRWKLVVRTAPHSGDELYDLESDPRETTNRIGEAPLGPVVAELRARLDAFHARHDVAGKRGVDPLPRHNAGSPWD
jgi:choline-sulfatase